MSDFSGEIAKIDELIKRAELAEAKTLLLQLVKLEPHREFLVPVAGLARRLSLPELGIKLLAPLVRPAPRKIMVPTVEEKAEYAANLVRLGVLTEAHEILSELPPHPRHFFFRALAHIAEWNYEEARKNLQSYLKFSESDPYETLVVKVNLAHSLFFNQQFAEAETLLANLRAQTAREEKWLLHVNVLERSAQLTIKLQHWKEAQSYLTQAQHLLKSTDSIDELLIKKMTAIFELMKSGGSTESQEKINLVKQEAQKKRRWETVRDCDFHRAKVTDNEELRLHLWHHLYFGTPYKFYRQMLMTEFSISPSSLPDQYIWQIGAEKKKQSAADYFETDTCDMGSFNVTTGENTFGTKFLKQGQAQQRLLQVLAADFYRPKKAIELFSLIYPNEHFIQGHSQDRFFQACTRLRHYFCSQKIPLMIVENFGFFKLVARDKFQIKMIVHREAKPQLRPDILKRVKEFWCFVGKEPFNVAAYGKFHKISLATASREIAQAFSNGLLEKINSGPKTRYRLQMN